MFTKTASFAVIDAQMARVGQGLVKDAHRATFDYTPRPGYLYVRSRAISSRTNDNFDTFPAEEIKQSYLTFVGKPVFVNHVNDNHRRARGVIIDAHLHEDANPDGSPDTWCEVLMEVDAVRFPKLAQAILAGEIDRTSMGTDVAFSVCSYCGNKATSPLEYCAHIPKLKGKKVRRTTASGSKEEILISEICYGLKFFENSLLVEPPADPTAYFLGVDTRGLNTTAAVNSVSHSITYATHFLPLPEARPLRIDASTLTSFQALLDTLATAEEMDDPIEVQADDHWVMTGRITRSGAVDFDLSSGERCWTVPFEDVTAARIVTGVDDVDKHLADKAALHEVSLAGHLVYDHNQPKRLPRKKEGLIALHESLHPEKTAGLHLAYGEIVAPMQVDTLRDESCPVCGESDSYNGSECMVCGFRKPPDMFMDPDLEKARNTDLRQDQAEDLSQVLDNSATLVCDGCGETFEGAYQGAPAEVPGQTPPAVDPNAPPGTEQQQPANVNDPSTLPGVKQWPDATGEPTVDQLQKQKQDQVPPVGKQPFQKLPKPKGDDTDAQQPSDTQDLKEPERKPEDKPQPPTGQAPEDRGAPKPDAQQPKPGEPPKPGEQPKPEQTGAPEEKPEDQTDRDVVNTQDTKGGPDSDTAKGDGTTPDVAPKEGDTCPICGQGLLRRKDVSNAVADTVDKEQDPKAANDDKSGDDKDGADKSDDNKPPWLKKKTSALSGGNRDQGRDGTSQKEQSMRPALQALAEQQQIIERQATLITEQENGLRRAEAAIFQISKLAGLEQAPWLAEMMRGRQHRMAMLRTADENNPAQPLPTPGSEGPAETTQQARQPDGTDSVMDVGASPVTDVAPDDATSVTTVGGEVANSDLSLNEEKVTAPVSGTEGPRPESETKTETDVQVDQPSTNNAFPLDPAWRTNSPVAEAARSNRMLASIRLARLQIQAGIAKTADDLELATEIETNTGISDASIEEQINTLSQVVQVQSTRQPGRVASRRLVPQAQNGGARSTPSMAGDVAPIRTATASASGDDTAVFE